MYLALGSNIEPERHLPAAVRELDLLLGVDRVSRVYESPAVGAPGTPRFLNAAVRVTTRLDPADLKLRILRPVERRLGRRRTDDRNAPRTIDIDIALFGLRSIRDDEAGLRIPDPEIPDRAYLALPLRDLAPDLVHPEFGRSLAEIGRDLEAESDIEERRDVALA